MAIRITQGSRSPSLTDTLTVDGLPFDLTGSSVKLKMRALASSTLKVNATATIVTAAAGTIRYDWGAGDLDTAGDYLAWWEVTLPSAKVQDHPEFLIDVQPHSQPSGNLCEVAEVRDYLQKPSGDREQDTVIERLITSASRLICDHAQREFAPAGTLTRTFRADTSLVDLAPYDLQSASAVTDTPVGGTPTTLVAGTDYDLGATFLGGTHLYLRFGAGYARSFTNFAYSTVSITGTWGMATVPADVTQAAIITVGMWMRREIQAFSQTFSIDEGRLERPEALPSAVRAMLAPYQRLVV